MQATFELSLYPLMNNYKAEVLDFINELHQFKNIEVVTNGLSTQIFGDFDYIQTQVIPTLMKQVWAQHQAVLVVKMGCGILKF